MYTEKLLVTGGSGFFGSRIAKFYKEKYPILLPSHKELDITDPSSIEAYFAKTCPDIVVHCAAVSDTGACERDPLASYAVNVTGCENLARISARYHAKLVLCSSDQVYFGSRLSGPHREDEAVTPINVYGMQKAGMEKSCLLICPDCVCLRLSWMYDSRSENEKEHGDFLRTLLRNLEAGNAVSYPVHDRRGITNVWDAILNLEKTFSLPGGIYNYGSSNTESTYRTALALFTHFHLDASALSPNEQAFRDQNRDLTMDQTKINNAGIFFPETINALMQSLEKLLY